MIILPKGVCRKCGVMHIGASQCVTRELQEAVKAVETPIVKAEVPTDLGEKVEAGAEENTEEFSSDFSWVGSDEDEDLVTDAPYPEDDSAIKSDVDGAIKSPGEN